MDYIEKFWKSRKIAVRLSLETKKNQNGYV